MTILWYHVVAIVVATLLVLGAIKRALRRGAKRLYRYRGRNRRRRTNTESA